MNESKPAEDATAPPPALTANAEAVVPQAAVVAPPVDLLDASPAPAAVPSEPAPVNVAVPPAAVVETSATPTLIEAPVQPAPAPLVEPSPAAPAAVEEPPVTPAPVPLNATEEATLNSTPTQTPSTTTDDDPPADAFPCIEQPIRVTLHCRNGYYLWGLRRGRVIARSKRNEKDEFRLNYIDASAGIVEIVHQKFGGILQVVVPEGGGGVAKVVCVKDEKDDKGEQKEEEEETNTNSERDEEEEFEDEPPSIRNIVTTSQKEDRQWCFVRGAHGEGVLLKSLRTGDNLAVDANGNVILAADESPDITTNWDMECVTGELCFLSNPRLEKRIRCDMAGLLSLTDAWKGWEVFRIMETGNHHYVKLASWMHSQWILCSTATGDVTCCSHAESLVVDNASGRCSEWAIEKSTNEGVIIRSKAHHRLLCVQDGELRTLGIHTSDENELATEDLLAVAAQQSTTNNSNAANKWWNNSVRSMNQSMRKVQKRLSQSSIKDDEKEVVVPQRDTITWQLEAAHLQTYYFLNVGNNPKQPRSIGPFPYATSNLRQTDKIQLKRTATTTKLYLTEKEQYISCSPEGNITLVQVHPDDDKNTEWIMEKPSYQEGGSVFRSKHYNYYLSYSMSNDGEDGQEEPPVDENNGGHFKNPFGGKPEPVAQLIGSETVGPREIWKLEPCMPRAVSSEKIKTFAIGTSIAVGTTIAMPFALAGASAVLGAVGAEAGVLFNAIAVGLTGAEALASVGAIGATAYIVFRPEENSLTDDHKREDEEEGERAWSKRPFSNWRNW